MPMYTVSCGLLALPTQYPATSDLASLPPLPHVLARNYVGTPLPQVLADKTQENYNHPSADPSVVIYSVLLELQDPMSRISGFASDIIADPVYYKPIFDPTGTGVVIGHQTIGAIVAAGTSEARRAVIRHQGKPYDAVLAANIQVIRREA